MSRFNHLICLCIGHRPVQLRYARGLGAIWCARCDHRLKR